MGARYRVHSRECPGYIEHLLIDAESGAVVLEPGADLGYYFDAAAMLNRGLSVEEVLNLLSTRPISKKCGC
ncbi:MAG: hypothetical protein KF778_22050 [Rhodocyclaceae bacterium]|nr:hypothetical protein [Rhodocyclaceae bacterium]MBX3671088.1 hypothetical protein [Rhodocyclaceae bacterium]